MQRARASRGHSVQLVHVQDGGRPEGVRGLPVNVVGEFYVVVEPEGLEGDGVGPEVVQHAGDAIKPQVLYVAAVVVHCHTEML